MKADDFSYEMSNCINNGVQVYPKYFFKDEVIDEVNFLAENWYIAVDNNGSEILYEKSIGTGSALRSTIKGSKKKQKSNLKWVEAVQKTYIFWSNKIDKLK